MWDFYGFLKEVKARIVLLRKRLANPFWGKRAKLVASLALSKAENTLEALVFQLYKNQINCRIAEKLPQHLLTGIIDAVMSGRSIFWFFVGMLKHPDTVFFEFDVKDKRKLCGEILKFARQDELKDALLHLWFRQHVQNMEYVCHPTKVSVQEHNLKGFLGSRERCYKYPEHPLLPLREFDYDKYFAY